MNEKDWKKFFQLVEKIVNAEKPVKEKESELKAEADKYDDGCLAELMAWDIE